MTINFISTEDLGKTSGGWSGINSNLYHEFSKSFKVNFIGPVNPKSSLKEKIVSKVQRAVGLRGSFHFLSEKRLQLIKELVNSRLSPEAEYNFFLGQMPWVKCNFDVPYGAYLDASFPTYLKVYSTPEHFKISDVSRIAALEKQWLQQAKHLFFGSYWALREVEAYYNCRFSNAAVVWVGGNMPIPEKDEYAGGFNFLFISLNFEKKGGHVCVEAFKKIRAVCPEATLTIVGQQPPASILQQVGIMYAGLLNKKDPEDLSKFIALLKKAFFLIHPTVMDAVPTVLTEAGYFGCPSIAPKSFGIPELVKDSETGILINTPLTADAISNPLLEIIEDNSRYLSIRREVKAYTSSQLTWEAVGKRITDSIITPPA